jgi:hypothetical protein
VNEERGYVEYEETAQPQQQQYYSETQIHTLPLSLVRELFGDGEGLRSNTAQTNSTSQ